MTKEKADRFIELLVKMVKLQRLIKVATYEQREVIYEKAEGVMQEIVDKFEGDITWCRALLTFGGQYYGQDTKMWVGDNMDDRTVKDALKREVYRQNHLEWKDGDSAIDGDSASMASSEQDYKLLFDDETDNQ